MSDLEARIAEVQTSHRSRIEYRDTGARFGTIVCNCGNRCGLDETYRAHVNERIAHMLAPVIREVKVEAWDKAVAALKGTIGAYTEEGVWALEQAEKHHPNPYRADNLEKP